MRIRSIISETLEENKFNVDLAFFNFLLFIFKISDYVEEKDKIAIGNKILNLFSFDDYIKIILDLDDFDVKKINDPKIRETKKRLIGYLKKYQPKILEYFSNEFDFSKYEKYENVTEKIIENVKKIHILNEGKKKMSELEISKIYKPKINTDIVKKSGAFSKDTKKIKLKKDPYDRKSVKHKNKLFTDDE